jgi:hypothetical protein
MDSWYDDFLKLISQDLGNKFKSETNKWDVPVIIYTFKIVIIRNKSYESCINAHKIQLSLKEFLARAIKLFII